MSQCYFIYPGFSQWSKTLLHFATSEGNVQRVWGLAQLGCDVSVASTILLDGCTLTNVTPLHIAIYDKNPRVLAYLLQGKNSNVAMNATCKSGHSSIGTPFEFALRSLKKEDPKTILVGYV